MSSNALTENEIKEIVIGFSQAYNGNIPLDFYIRDTQEEFYGPEASQEKVGIIEAAYLPKTGAIQLVRTNLRDHERAERAIRHELLGHYALNTLDPDQKRQLLDRIVEAREEPSLKPLWQTIDKVYPHQSPLLRAEEVFAFVAENEPGLSPASKHKAVFSTISAQPLTLERLEQQAALLAEGIRQGAQQKTFPQSDSSQFRQSAPNPQRLASMRDAVVNMDQKTALETYPELASLYHFVEATHAYLDAQPRQVGRESRDRLVQSIRERTLTALACGDQLPQDSHTLDTIKAITTQATPDASLDL